ncbi:hypothetical protein D3C81_2243710 [compost metagenome]
MVGLAKEINLPVDYDLLQKDIEDKTYINEVNEHYNKADKLNIDSTPTFFINGVEFTGNLGNYDEFKQAIDNASTNK